MAAQALLKDQSSVGGLQSPQPGKRLAFSVAKGDMVQILHSGQQLTKLHLFLSTQVCVELWGFVLSCGGWLH